MTPFSQFLRNAKSAVQLSRSVVFVVGNESCDMDSFASSILTAFFYHHTASGQPVVPLINIPRTYLSLRADIVHVMTTLGIKNEWLLFIDDNCIVKRRAESSTDKLFLVDHNRVTPTITKLLGDSVVGVIDHHADEKLYGSSIGPGPHVIKKSGSCSSLVMNYWRTQILDEVFFSNPELAILALCPLLLDTSNMKDKVEDPDRENYEWLKKSQEISDIKELYKTLQRKKKDLSSLSVKGILAKDYKEWGSGGEDSDKKKLGISTIPESAQWLEVHHPDLYQEFKEWANEQGLSVAVMMTSFSDNKKHRRQLVIWINSNESDAIASVSAFVDLQQPAELALKPTPTEAARIAGVQIYEQENARASRKQVAPLLRQQLHGESLTSL
jgi:exopolyphosphatase